MLRIETTVRLSPGDLASKKGAGREGPGDTKCITNQAADSATIAASVTPDVIASATTALITRPGNSDLHHRCAGR